MKYLKLFEDAAFYETWKSSKDYVLPNVSYIKETKGVVFNPKAKPATSPNLVCTYNVTDISDSTPILYDYALDYMTSMIVDGVEMNVWTYKQFKTIGLHTVEFVLKDPTTFGSLAFQNCSSLYSVTIPNSVTSIGNRAFYECKELTSITIPNSVTSIGNLVFSNCSLLTSVTIPNSVTSIGDSAFQGCSSLTSVIIPNSVTSIGKRAFSSCSGLHHIIISDSLTSIENSAFQNCSLLTSVTIPNSVTSIGNSSFYGCSSLTSVIIPNSVTSIGKNAFAACTALVEITCLAPTAPTIYSDTFWLVDEHGVLKVPTGSNYRSWMSTNNNYLGKYNWKIEYI